MHLYKKQGLLQIAKIILLSLPLIILAVYGSKYSKRQNIYITEICVNNKVNAYDDDGRYDADYIEIYNDSDKVLNLSRYMLSDGKNDFCLGDIDIDPGEAMIVWNSNYWDDPNNYLEDYDRKDIHGMPFGLSAGEEISLKTQKKSIIQMVKLPDEIAEDKVYASSLNNKKEFYITDPSPYYLPENIELTKESISVDEPILSLEGGWYDEGTKLDFQMSDADIYYTLDGTIPDVNSTKYTGEPIILKNRSNEANIYSSIGNISLKERHIPEEAVDKATVVNAVAVKDGNYSDIISETFFVGLAEEYKNYSVMEITTDPEGLFDYENGIYVAGKTYDTYLSKFGKEDIYYNANYAKEGFGWERKAKIELYDEDKNKQLVQDIGIRIHGGYSTAINQKSFNLYARSIYDGNDYFNYDFWGNKLSKIMLRNGGFEDSYATKQRDVFNQSLIADRSPWIQKARPCVVFLNGEYWGLYNLQEKLGIDYVREYSGLSEDKIQIMKNEDLVYGNPEVGMPFYDMVDYAVSNDMSDDEYYSFIENQMDIQSFIDYYIFEIYIANYDSIINNHAKWRAVSDNESAYQDGKWRWLIYDTDESAGLASNCAYDIDSFVTGQWDVNPLGENGDELLLALMDNEEFKERFVVTFFDMANNNFRYDLVHKKLIESSEIYRDQVIKSRIRFRGSGSDESYDNEIKDLDDFYKYRYSYLSKYIKDDLDLSGDIYKITIAGEYNDKCQISINTIENLADNWKGEYISDYPVRLKCDVNAGYHFVEWTDDKGNKLSSEKEMELYLDKDIKLYPVIEAD